MELPLEGGQAGSIPDGVGKIKTFCLAFDAFKSEMEGFKLLLWGFSCSVLITSVKLVLWHFSFLVNHPGGGAVRAEKKHENAFANKVT